MAFTTFTGPVRSLNGFVLPNYAATEIADIDSPLNQSFKQQGLTVWDTTNSKMKTATGSAPDSTWVDATGANAVTPS